MEVLFPAHVQAINIASCVSRIDPIGAWAVTHRIHPARQATSGEKVL